MSLAFEIIPYSWMKIKKSIRLGSDLVRVYIAAKRHHDPGNS